MVLVISYYTLANNRRSMLRLLSAILNVYITVPNRRTLLVQIWSVM